MGSINPAIEPKEVLKIVVDCEPVSKARSRTVYRNGKVWNFTPKKTKNAEELLRLTLKEKNIQPFPPEIPLKLTVTFYRVKNHNVKKGVVKPVIRPDLDNYLKLVSDSLMPEVIHDDAQITTLVAMKRWSDKPTGSIEFTLEADNG
jgi:Holliday junction resolvase RusA-like endonuclease